ncbi:hypothetical protein QYM36_005502 [Artemia franciscana]|uniref:Uncharacterized protein n=1 Tax=Artemia franciscana TaxID=6661 RepID=A0AA88I4R5_ARTSF|nr:hypothetical protein QYM36_005502 [Artemia franciscana]
MLDGDECGTPLFLPCAALDQKPELDSSRPKNLRHRKRKKQQNIVENEEAKKKAVGFNYCTINSDLSMTVQSVDKAETAREQESLGGFAPFSTPRRLFEDVSDDALVPSAEAPSLSNVCLEQQEDIEHYSLPSRPQSRGRKRDRSVNKSRKSSKSPRLSPLVIRRSLRLKSRDRSAHRSINGLDKEEAATAAGSALYCVVSNQLVEVQDFPKRNEENGEGTQLRRHRSRRLTGSQPQKLTKMSEPTASFNPSHKLPHGPKDKASKKDCDNDCDLSNPKNTGYAKEQDIIEKQMIKPLEYDTGENHKLREKWLDSYNHSSSEMIKSDIPVSQKEKPGSENITLTEKSIMKTVKPNEAATSTFVEEVENTRLRSESSNTYNYNTSRSTKSIGPISQGKKEKLSGEKYSLKETNLVTSGKQMDIDRTTFIEKRERQNETQTCSVLVNCSVPTKGMQKSFALSNSSFLASQQPPKSSEVTTSKNMERALSDKQTAKNNGASFIKHAKRRSNISKSVSSQEEKNFSQLAMQHEGESSALVIEVIEQDSRTSDLNDLLDRIKAAELAELKNELAKRYVEVTNRKNFQTNTSEQKDSVTITRRRHVTEPPGGTKSKEEYANKSITETLRKWKSTKLEMFKVTGKSDLLISEKNDPPDPRLKVFDWKDEIRMSNAPPQTRAENTLSARGRAVARRGRPAKGGRKTGESDPLISGKDDLTHPPLSHWKGELRAGNALPHIRAQQTVSAKGKAVAKRGRPLTAKPVCVVPELISKPVYVKDTQRHFAEVCSPDSLRLPASSLATNESPSLSDNSSQSKNLPPNINERVEHDIKGKTQSESQMLAEVKPPVVLNRIRQKAVKKLSEPSASVGNSSSEGKGEVAARSSNEITDSCLKELSFSSRKNNLNDSSVSLPPIESRVLDASMEFKPSPSSSLVHSGRSVDSPTLSIRSGDLDLASPLSSVRSTDGVVKSPFPCVRSPENASAYAVSTISLSDKSPKNGCQINERLVKLEKSGDLEISKKACQLAENTPENSKIDLTPNPEVPDTNSGSLVKVIESGENSKHSVLLFSRNDVNQYLNKLCDRSEDDKAENDLTSAKNKLCSSANVGIQSLSVQKDGGENQKDENQPDTTWTIKDMSRKYRSKSEPRLKIKKIKQVKQIHKNTNPILLNLSLSSRIPDDFVSEEKLAIARPQHKYIVDVESLSPFCESLAPPSPKTTNKNVQPVNVRDINPIDNNDSHEIEAVEPEPCSKSLEVRNSIEKENVSDSTSVNVSGSFLEGCEMPCDLLSKIPKIICESSYRDDQLSNPQPGKSVIDTLFDEIPRSLSPIGNIPSRVIIPRRSPHTEALIRIQRMHGLTEISTPLKYSRIIESSMVSADNKIRNGEAFVAPGVSTESKIVESDILKEIGVPSQNSAYESRTDSCQISALKRKNIPAKASGGRSTSGLSEVSCASGENNVLMQDITNLGEIFDLEVLEKPTPGVESRQRLTSSRKDNNHKMNFVISDDCPGVGAEIELDQESCGSPKSSNCEMDLLDNMPLRKRRYSSSSVAIHNKTRTIFMEKMAVETANKSSVLLPRSDASGGEILDLEPLAKKVTEEILAKAREESQPVFAKKSRPAVDPIVEDEKASILRRNEKFEAPTSTCVSPDLFDGNPINNECDERPASAILNSTNQLAMRSNVRSSMSDCTFEKQFRSRSGKWVVKVERLSQVQVNRIQDTLKNQQKYLKSKNRSPSNAFDDVQDPMLSSVACDSISLDETSNYKDFDKSISKGQPSGSGNTGKVVRGLQSAKSSQSRDSPGGPSETSVSPGRSLGLFEGTIGSSTAGLDWDFAIDVSDLDLL